MHGALRLVSNALLPDSRGLTSAAHRNVFDNLTATSTPWHYFSENAVHVLVRPITQFGLSEMLF